MFDADDEEYVLLNNELHPRAKRFDIDLCNMSCFGLHSLSRDKKWTTWGHRWVQDWVDHPPDKTNHFKMRYTLMKQGTLTGDSTPRYDLIRRIGALLHPEAVIEDYVNSHPERMRERERFSKSFLPFAEKIGVKGLRDERILTCGQCALVCGPTVEESSNRFHALIESGLVVPGPESEMVNVPTYEHAVEMRRKYLPRVSGKDKLKDALASTILWHKYYFGINPKSIIRGIIYDLKLKKAVRGKVSQEN
jgi:hypothetical protein